LFGLQLTLAELLLKNRELILRPSQLRVSLRELRASLLLSRANLLIVERCDRVSGFDAVAFAKPDFQDAPARFWRDCGVIALDSAAQADDAVRCARAREENSPCEKRSAGYDQQDDENSKSTRQGTDLRGRDEFCLGILLTLFWSAFRVLIFFHFRLSVFFGGVRYYAFDLPR
jgi:hypothetical protein